MARLKIKDVQDRGFPQKDIFHLAMDNAPEMLSWFKEQGFKWRDIRIGSAVWVVFDTPERAIAFKMRWL